MRALDNLTPFAAACIPSLSRDEQQVVVVIVAARFELPRPDQAQLGEPRIAEEQPPVRLIDEYSGDPANSSLRHEGQSAYMRPGTDIYVDGLAWTPGGRPAAQSTVAVRVGPCQKVALVFGDRFWNQGLLGPTPSQPRPFTSLPLAYERCFGGSPSNPSRALAEAAAHNPVGQGLHRTPAGALGQPVPNFEDPQAPLRTSGDRPRPAGFGPVARHWLPRLAFAGTYDDAWIQKRMPFWPRDFDERFFCAAAPGLCAVPHLVGGEPVQLVGMSPEGTYAFELPRLHLRARFEVGSSGWVRRDLVLDAISFEPEASSFTMILRAHVAADALSLGAVVVRMLEPWEVTV
jgi:hypothetical protein